MSRLLAHPRQTRDALAIGLDEIGHQRVHAFFHVAWVVALHVDLANRLAGVASATDVSSSYRLFRLTGPCATRLLQRGAFVDFSSPAFRLGSVAVTAIAHIGVIIRQLDAAPSYEIAVFRSLGGAFQHWLTTTAGTL